MEQYVREATQWNLYHLFVLTSTFLVLHFLYLANHSGKILIPLYSSQGSLQRH